MDRYDRQIDRLLTRASNTAINRVARQRRLWAPGELTFYSSLLTCGSYISMALLLGDGNTASRSPRILAGCVHDAVEAGHKLQLNDLVWFVSLCALYPIFRHNTDNAVRQTTVTTLGHLVEVGDVLNADAKELEALFDAPRPPSPKPGAVPMGFQGELFVKRLVELAALRLVNRSNLQVSRLDLLLYAQLVLLGYKTAAEQS